MKIKRLIAIILTVITLFCLVSCKSGEKLGEPPVPMKWAEQTDSKGYVKFKMQIPEDWILVPYYVFGVNGWDSSVSEETIESMS